MNILHIPPFCASEAWRDYYKFNWKLLLDLYFASLSYNEGPYSGFPGLQIGQDIHIKTFLELASKVLEGLPHLLTLFSRKFRNKSELVHTALFHWIDLEIFIECCKSAKQSTLARDWKSPSLHYIPKQSSFQCCDNQLPCEIRLTHKEGPELETYQRYPFLLSDSSNQIWFCLCKKKGLETVAVFQ